jgi:hypothetical protein
MDVRYPFDNAYEFISGYLFDLAALHLTISYIFLSFIIITAFRYSSSRIQASCLLYFLLAVYNNPAFLIYGITIQEYFGIYAALHFFTFQLNNYIKIFLAHKLLLCVLTVISLYSILCYLYITVEFKYVADASFHSRLIVLFKLWVNFIVGFVLLAGLKRNGEILLVLIYYSVIFISVVYVLQMFLFILNINPYGSFVGASVDGEGAIFSFGAMSIERGHLAKFQVLIFPIFIYACNHLKKKLFIIPVFLVMLFNFSASSYAYMILYILLIFFLSIKKNLFNIKIFFLLIPFFLFIYLFNDAIFMLFEKIYLYGFINSSEGGRSISAILEYWNIYPFGFGYGGSKFRNIVGLQDINSGFISILTQFGPLLGIFSYTYILFCVIRFFKMGYNRIGVVLLSIIPWLLLIVIIDPMIANPYLILNCIFVYFHIKNSVIFNLNKKSKVV